MKACFEEHPHCSIRRGRLQMSRSVGPSAQKNSDAGQSECRAALRLGLAPGQRKNLNRVRKPMQTEIGLSRSVAALTISAWCKRSATVGSRANRLTCRTVAESRACGRYRHQRAAKTVRPIT
jgi:hypothetical protein